MIEPLWKRALDGQARAEHIGDERPARIHVVSADTCGRCGRPIVPASDGCRCAGNLPAAEARRYRQGPLLDAPCPPLCAAERRCRRSRLGPVECGRNANKVFDGKPVCAAHFAILNRASRT